LSRLKEKEAFRELFPAVSVKWDDSSGIVSNKEYFGDKYQLRMKHPLYHGGELKYTWEQSKANLRIAEENYKKSIEDFAHEVIKTYYELVKTEKNSKVQENLLKELESDLDMAKKEYDAELLTLVEFLNVQAQYNQAYYANLSSQNSLSLARLHFLQLLNLDRKPDISTRVGTDLKFKELNVDLEECVALAYENRADLKINELSLEAAVHGEKVAGSQQLPWVDLTGRIGRSGEAFAADELQMSDDWFVGAKINIPWGPNTMKYSYTDENIAPSLTTFTPTDNEIHSLTFDVLDNLSSFTESQQAEVTRQRALADLLKLRQTIAAEVREAYFSYQETILKVKNSLANHELYKKELLIVEEKRSINEAQTSDVIGSKVKVAGEETNYNSLLADYALAVEKLNKVIGVKDYFRL
ncbi:MAG: TolC family protein, partial [Candidatus Omnitrophota bacterium]